MESDEIRIGMRVKITGLKSTRGMFIDDKHLKVRKVGIIGTIEGWVPGHGGDVWWIRYHYSGRIGVYASNEFEKF